MSWLDDFKSRSLSRRTLVTFNLDVDYVVSAADRETPFAADNRCITDFLVRNAIASRYKDGIKDRTVQRIVARVQNALVRAVRDDQDTVELSDDQLRLALDCLKEWSVPAGLVAWHGDLLDAVEDALEASKLEKVDASTREKASN